MDGEGTDKSPPRHGHKHQTQTGGRREALSLALRQNLQRRKAQQRGRAAGAGQSAKIQSPQGVEAQGQQGQKFAGQGPQAQIQDTEGQDTEAQDTKGQNNG